MTVVQSLGYFALAKTLPTINAFPDIVAALDSLDDYLAFRTFLVGHEITAADWILWGALKGRPILRLFSKHCLMKIYCCR